MNEFDKVFGELFPDAKPLLEAMEKDRLAFEAEVEQKREKFRKEREESRARFERRRVAMGFPPRPPEDW